MADNIFEISVDDHAYRMVLPHWQTDYIFVFLSGWSEVADWQHWVASEGITVRQDIRALME